MNYIIFDVEATCWQGNHHKQQEIIEIGAVKINGYGEAISLFNSFVRPILNPNLSVFCKELTNITQMDVNRAPRFPEVIEDFKDWIDVEEDNYLLCSWGSFDKKILISDCQLHNLENEWVDNFINLKRQYHEIKGLRHPRGMKKVLEKEGFEFTGEQHRGIDDAKNLAKIFLEYIDEWKF